MPTNRQPINHLLSTGQAALTSTDNHPDMGSNSRFLAELLTLHEEMVTQLRFERLEVVGRADFLTVMISEHETAAAMLRTKLGHAPAEIRRDGLAVTTGETGPVVARSSDTKPISRRMSWRQSATS